MRNSHIVVALTLLLLFSCEESNITDCSECNPGENYIVELKIPIRTPEYIPSNPIVTIYEGAMEDNIVLERFTVNESYSYITFDAVLYKDYTACLEFILDGKQYISIGAACPKVRYDKTSCNEPCYYVYDNVIDLKLRYY